MFVCCNCDVSLLPAKCVYIQCESCQKNGTDVTLCVPCFRMGAECGPHKRGHAYIVIDPQGPSLLGITDSESKRWGWKEDLKLIRAAQKHKIGNWEEIASELDTDKTAEDARRHFDRFFIHGPFGRYASSICSWPCIDDQTDGTASFPHSNPDLSDRAHMLNSSDWQYITEFFRDWDQPVDFDDPDWFDQFEEPLMKFKDEFYTSPLLSSAKKNDDNEQQNFERQDSPQFTKLPLSPFSVEFFRTDERGRKKRLLSVSDFDESEDEETNSESNNMCDYKADSANKRGRGREKRRYLNSSGGLQSTDDGSEADQLYDKKKPVLRLRRVGRKWRKKDGGKRRMLKKETFRGKLLVKINEDVKKRLRNLYPEQFYVNVPLLPFGAEERSRLKDNDLQLLAYMPEREDFEWEYKNDAERLISRLLLPLGRDKDEDSAFESAVKLAKIQKYNRILKQRRAKKAAVREYELVNKFFDKIKKIEETRRNVVCNQQHLALVSQQELLNSFMKKTYQIARRSEMKQLLDAITGYISLNEKILNLESLKADGIKDLKGRSKVVCDRSKGKHRRRPLYCNEVQRKSHLRWKRFKRWTMQQAAAEFGSVELDA